jgi:hypothetical protein
VLHIRLKCILKVSLFSSSVICDCPGLVGVDSAGLVLAESAPAPAAEGLSPAIKKIKRGRGRPLPFESDSW